ncbi:MAG: hypothetical protein IPM18_11320 [Phycisphaerales bacterium]|nr:hypothetical protein [Phycisphaerales bacterium]
MAPIAPSAWLNAYRRDLRSALAQAADDGFHAVDAAVAREFLDPSDFGASAQRHLRKTLRDLGLQLDGLALLTPGAGLADPRYATERMEHLRATLTLGVALGVPRLTVNLSGFDDPRHDGLAAELLATLAEWSDRFAMPVAVHDPAANLDQTAGRIRALRCPTMLLAVDTARDVTPPAEVATLGLTGAVHLRDVRRHGDGFEETAFGEGDVDFRTWLAQLAGAEAAPGLVIRADSARAVDALRRGREYIAGL